MVFEKMNQCCSCGHDLEEYKDREEWLCCPFCGIIPTDDNNSANKKVK